MSRSNSVDIKNPAVKFFEWSGSRGTITYYDKEEKETKNEKLPFAFLVLDKLCTIKGYSDEDESGIWSNEIRNTKTEVLTVRTKNGIKQRGLYDEIKNISGAKFAQSLYIGFYNENKELVIGNLKLFGCGFAAWLDFIKGKNIYKGVIRITGNIEGKKGANKFYSPVFEYTENVSEKAETQAVELDKEVQEYLKLYLASGGQLVESESEDYRTARDRELSDYGDSGESEALANPIATSINSLLTAKQLQMIRALARDKNLDPEKECQEIYECAVDQLNKKAASAFIQHLQEIEFTGSPDVFDPTFGRGENIKDDEIPWL